MSLPSTFLDNISGVPVVSDVGFKISKPGYSALTAAGQNLLFSSGWPSLPIAYEITIPNPITSGSSFAAIPHNLNFPPFTMGWYYYTDPSGIIGASNRFQVMADKTNFYMHGNQSGHAPYSATKLKLRAFQIDLSKDINYQLAPGDTFKSPYDPDYGIKVVKAGKSIDSKDLRDFAIHSRAQSPLILAVKTEQTSNPSNADVVQYTTKLAYPAWVYGFIKLGTSLAGSFGVPVNTYLPAQYYSQSYPRTFTDGFTSYVQFNTGVSADNGATLVILRDPMFAPTPVTVQY
jgi:hypothetical protein